MTEAEIEAYHQWCIAYDACRDVEYLAHIAVVQVNNTLTDEESRAIELDRR